MKAFLQFGIPRTLQGHSKPNHGRNTERQDRLSKHQPQLNRVSEKHIGEWERRMEAEETAKRALALETFRTRHQDRQLLRSDTATKAVEASEMARAERERELEAIQGRFRKRVQQRQRNANRWMAVDRRGEATLEGSRFLLQRKVTKFADLVESLEQRYKDRDPFRSRRDEQAGRRRPRTRAVGARQIGPEEEEHMSASSPLENVVQSERVGDTGSVKESEKEMSQIDEVFEDW